MPRPDYAGTPEELVWFAEEATFNTLTDPATTDAVIPLPGVTLPPVLPEFTPSIQRSPSAGVRELIKRKKRPGAWSIPTYLKAAAAAGTAPQVRTALKRGFGVETVNAGVSVVYTLATAIQETSFSIWHWKDNIMSGFRGCLANVIRAEVSGSDEGRVVLEGFAGNEVFAGTSKVGIAMDAVQTTLTLPAGEARRFQVGPAASDVVHLQIESEIVKVTAVNYSTDVLTIVRAQKASAAATHALNIEVAPWKPAVDPDADDTVAPIVLGTITLGTLVVRGISFSEEINNALEPRLDEWGEDVLTGYRRTGKRQVTGAFRAYARQSVQALLSNLERGLVEDAVIVAGSAGTASLTFDIDRMRLNNVALDGGGAEFIFEFSYQALESTVGNDETKWTYA